ncbi:platelet binding protein GspB-like, partial [Trifolium pratense]
MGFVVEAERLSCQVAVFCECQSQRVFGCTRARACSDLTTLVIFIDVLNAECRLSLTKMEQQMRQDNHQEEAVACIVITDISLFVHFVYEKQVAEESSGFQQGAVGERSYRGRCFTCRACKNPSRGEDPTLLKIENTPYKSPITSIVPRDTRQTAVHENDFVTPRPRGRSAIYNMARTQYSRVYPTSTLKGVVNAVQVEPSSSTQSAMNLDMLSGSTRG